MIPKKVPPMIEPLRTLVLEGIKMAGSLDAAEVLTYIEERLSVIDFGNVASFLKWLKTNSLSVGYGTIDLRWNEYWSSRAPVSQEAAYQWAIKRVKKP